MARFLSTAIVIVCVASMARLASAQDGPGATVVAANPAAAPAGPVPAATPAPAVPVTEAIRLDEYLNRRDQWRNEGRITAAQAARARRLLNAAVVSGDRSVRVPLDASGLQSCRARRSSCHSIERRRAGRAEVRVIRSNEGGAGAPHKFV